MRIFDGLVHCRILGICAHDMRSYEVPALPFRSTAPWTVKSTLCYVTRPHASIDSQHPKMSPEDVEAHEPVPLRASAGPCGNPSSSDTAAHMASLCMVQTIQ